MGRQAGPDHFEAGVLGNLPQPRLGQDREMLLAAEDEVFKSTADASPIVGIAREPAGVSFGELPDRRIAIGTADPEAPPRLETAAKLAKMEP